MSNHTAAVRWSLHAGLLPQLRFGSRGEKHQNTPECCSFTYFIFVIIVVCGIAVCMYIIDISMHAVCLLKEHDPAVRWISVLNNMADQLYYPCEHIAWAADAELIKIKSDKWWLFSTLLWSASLLLGILRSICISPHLLHHFLQFELIYFFNNNNPLLKNSFFRGLDAHFDLK